MLRPFLHGKFERRNSVVSSRVDEPSQRRKIEKNGRQQAAVAMDRNRKFSFQSAHRYWLSELPGSSSRLHVQLERSAQLDS